MKSHTQLMRDILAKGRRKVDRTGTGTYSIFGPQLEFDMDDGFPLPLGREIKIKAILKELMWFLRGETNTITLGAKIWDLWALKQDAQRERLLSFEERLHHYSDAATAREQLIQGVDRTTIVERMDAEGVPTVELLGELQAGECGPIYGAMWRRWPNPDGTTTDQIAELLTFLGSDNARKRASRRLVISGWNPSFLPVEGRPHEENILDNKQVLPPCHTVFQFIVEPLTRDERIAFMEKTHGREKVAATGIAAACAQWNNCSEDIIDDILRQHNVPIEMLSLKLYAR
jgi:thymidylate synthase